MPTENSKARTNSGKRMIWAGILVVFVGFVAAGFIESVPLKTVARTIGFGGALLIFFGVRKLAEDEEKQPNKGQLFSDEREP